MSEIRFKLTATTNVGLVRTNNEDNFTICHDLSKGSWTVPEDTDSESVLGESGCLLVVADGMGGMNAGEVASEIAVTSIRNAFSQGETLDSIIKGGRMESFMKKAIVAADSEIKKKVKDDPSTSGMGTTVVMAWILGDVVHVAWCGDSRAYLYNKQSGISRLSCDHSYVQELVNSGKLDPELAFDHPNSNIITRSLGDSSNAAQPDYVCHGLSKGDQILLCSDGLCGLLRDEEIVSILEQEHESIDACRDALIAGALQAGGHDNVTVALFECTSEDVPELERTLTSTLKSRKGRHNFLAWLVAVLLLALAGLIYVSVHNGWIELTDKAPRIQLNKNTNQE